MPRPNYHKQVKQQKERAKKARHEEKQQRKLAARLGTPGEAGSDDSTAGAAAPSDPVSANPSVE